MQLGKLDHVNVRTAKVQAMSDWYVKVLGLRSGDRPPFPFPGAWLYIGDHPYVHLVGVTADPANTDPKLEHFAFNATGLAGFLDMLTREKIEHETRRVPGFGIVQVNVWDPDGNHIHIDFPPSEDTLSANADWGQKDAMIKR